MKKNVTRAIIIAVAAVIIAIGAFYVMKDTGEIPEQEEPVASVVEELEKPLTMEAREKPAPAEETKLPGIKEKEEAVTEETTVKEGYLEKQEFRQPLEEKKTRQEQVREEMEILFTYLDDRGYAEKYGLEKGTFHHFKSTTSLLLSKSPVIVGETQDVYVLTRNMAHFYRVAKKGNINLVKEILRTEKDIIEPSTALIYEWFMLEQTERGGKSTMTLANYYEYAAYFLETVSGTAYLMRRDSRTRLLTTYYAILVIYEAEEKNLNKYGIDAVPHIDRLIEDMRSYMNLDDKETYIATLSSIEKEIKEKRG